MIDQNEPKNRVFDRDTSIHLTKTIHAYVEERLQSIEEALDRLLQSHHPLHQSLIEAARYSVLSKAKRLRPLIVLAIAECYHIPFEHVIDPACSIEILHTYTLIHDDLPCMDNELMRRGKPALHHIYPEGHSVLTGDFLLTLAFDILAHAPHLSDSDKILLIQSLTRKTGGDGVIAGQVIDLNQHIEHTHDSLIYMYKRKTADLFTAAFEFGAIIAHVSQRDQKLLKEFGEQFGLIFQFIDDLEDYESDSDKITAPHLFGIQKTIDIISTSLKQLDEKSKEISIEIPLLHFLISQIEQKLNALTSPERQQWAEKNPSM
ncbi:MAG: polyprenyl synthetase family protein [Simkaniaceae bacterium]|nr:polyprenyl synthetase family protein [Simkaniaceae bacterium]MCF7851727.1 polyprenyl synthetase family protein [Simkaniaceae bacterium]